MNDKAHAKHSHIVCELPIADWQAPANRVKSAYINNFLLLNSGCCESFAHQKLPDTKRTVTIKTSYHAIIQEKNSAYQFFRTKFIDNYRLLLSEVHIFCIAKRVTENAVNSNLYYGKAHLLSKKGWKF